MTQPRLLRVSRRDLVVAGLAGGAALAVGVYGGYKYGRRKERGARIVPPREQPFAPNAFVAVDRSGEVTIWLGQAEVGQGVATSLPVSIADELGARAEHVRVVLAPADAAYGWQFTAVSSSVKDHWYDLRRAGAAARALLVTAAATAFEVEPASCRAENGAVVHPATGRRLPFGALVDVAARLPVPDDAPLRGTDELRYIGRSMPRLDHPAKVDGSARYGLDVRVAGMAFAVVARCPTVGGRVAGFDEAAARAVPGVLGVHEIESGVAVLGVTTHAAIAGRAALRPTYERGQNAAWSTERVDEALAAGLARDGAVARRDGDGAAGLDRGARRLVAEYSLPYLAHATMEPMNCTADVRPDGCTIDVPTQAPQVVRDEAARMLGLPPERVLVRPTWVGGAFGRRVAMDFVREAVAASRLAGRPVQVVWTREDDTAHDLYRPCSRHRLEAALDDAGNAVAWHHRIVAPSILMQDPSFAEDVDPVAVEGAREVPYAMPDVQVEFVPLEAPFRLGFWRSVGHSYNAFAVECFVDELAAAAGVDAVEYRRRHLVGPEAAVHRGVLERAVAEAGEPPSGEGRGRGVAVHASFGSVVAMLADVRVDGDRLQVERVTAAVDCGYAVHPDGVVAQIEGGVAFALSAMLHGEMTFAEGAARESNFHDQPLLRMREMPRVDVHLVTRDTPPEKLGGVGEIGVPPLAPAVANAVFAATGRRLRTLPARLG